MTPSFTIVVTTIAPPTRAMENLASKLSQMNGTLYVVGDLKGPENYPLPRTKFLSFAHQGQQPWQLARLLPSAHYTRKNLGYLLALQDKPDCIIETDDDNAPLPSFWTPRARQQQALRLTSAGWVNVYRCFTEEMIWPRGFPLENLQVGPPSASMLAKDSTESCEALVQQGLANGDPDVDAVYRLTRVLPFSFQDATPVFLGKDAWCPFNSQNTTFFREAFPLLYLPSFCTFRMTDIWRSFVAQRCLWQMDSGVLFTSPTVFQDRNEHRLLKDFEQEIPGYLGNARIAEILSALSLASGRNIEVVCANLLSCYEKLVAEGFFPSKEIPLLRAWIADLKQIEY